MGREGCLEREKVTDEEIEAPAKGDGVSDDKSQGKSKIGLGWN